MLSYFAQTFYNSKLNLRGRFHHQTLHNRGMLLGKLVLALTPC